MICVLVVTAKMASALPGMMLVHGMVEVAVACGLSVYALDKSTTGPFTSKRLPPLDSAC